MTAQRNEILFIDANVSNAQSLVVGISPDVEIVFLDDKTNVISQIAAVLDGRQNLDAIHLVSHGANGELAFANGLLNIANITDYAPQLKRIGSSLSENGDLLLYGCDVAKDDSGLAFINQLSALTDADVAASEDLAGNSSLGANWILESIAGSVETNAVVQNDVDGFDGTLVTDDYPSGSAGSVSVGGSVTGVIETVDDLDLFKVSLVAGSKYTFELKGVDTGKGTLADPYLNLVHSDGTYLSDNDSGIGWDSLITFTPTSSGTCYIGASDGSLSGTKTGSYTLSVTKVTATTVQDDYPTDNSGTVSVNGSTTGVIETAGDLDGFSVSLVAGHQYTFELKGADTGNGTLVDPYLYFGSLSPVSILGSDNDSGTGYNSLLSFTVPSSGGGTYALIAESNTTTGTGSYTLSVTDTTNQPPTGMVTINGTRTRGEVLTATNTLTDINGLGVISYQWKADGSNIGTGSTYTLTNAEVGKAISVTASYTDGLGKLESVSSAMTTPIQQPTIQDDYPASSTGIVSVNGSTTGVIETAGDIDDFAVSLVAGYQYTFELKGADTGNGTLADPYLDFLSSDYVYLSDNDSGAGWDSLISFTATSSGTAYLGAWSSGGSGTGSYTLTVTETIANHPPTAPTAAKTLPDGLESTDYFIWQSDLLSGFTDADGDMLSITNLTATNGTLTPSSTGNAWWFTPNTSYYGSVSLSYVVTDGKTGGSVTAPAVNFNVKHDAAPTGNITITGTAKVGETLTPNISGLFDIDGIDGASFGYSWYIDGVPISSGSSYIVNAADTNKNISLVASYRDGLGKQETVTSSSVLILPSPTYSLFIDKSTVTEGESATLNLQTTSVAPGTQIGFTFTGSATTADVSGGYIQPYFTVLADGAATMPLTFLNDYLIEAPEYLTFTLTNDPTKSATISIKSLDPTYQLSVDKSIVNEGESANLNLQTANVAPGTQVGFTFTGSATTADVSGGYIQPYFTIGGDGTAKIPLLFIKDHLTEGTENLTFTLLNDTTKSATISIINDTSQADNLPMGDLVISGTPAVGQSLFVQNNVQDLDGLSGVVMNYQWFSDNMPISGAVQTSYVLTAADAGRSISVKVNYIDLQDNAESVTSKTPVLVADPQSPPTGSVTIGVSAQETQVLTAVSTLQDANGLGMFSYQWLRTGSPISGATQSTYIPSVADVNNTVSVRVSYTDGLGKLESVTSNSTAPVASYHPADVGKVVVSGKAEQNQLLTATNNFVDTHGIKDNLVQYQWLRNGVPISSATQNTYTLMQVDVGQKISVAASYTDGVGKLESRTSNETVSVANVNDLPTGSVSISGAATPGQVLAANNSISDVDGLNLSTIGYQWLSDGVAISGATKNTYMLTTADVGKAISVKASYTDLQGTTESLVSAVPILVSAPQTPPTGNVVINGTAQETQTLSVTNTLDDVNKPISAIGYQWLSDGVEITGATQSTYTLTIADIGQTISVKASYTDGLSKLESVVSSSTGVVTPFHPPIPTDSTIISGTAAQNQTLTVTKTPTDTHGIVDSSIQYQWLSDDAPIAGATQNTYTLTQAEVGKSVSVKFSYTDKFGDSESATSNVISNIRNINDLPTGSVSITGTTTEGQVLTAVNNSIADLDGMSSSKIVYQWLSDGKTITNANKSTYTLSKADVGKKISVKLSYTDDFGATENVTSPVTALVIATPFDGMIKTAPSNNKALLIGGAKNDFLTGLAGADTLRGAAGNDSLDGGLGNDSIEGGNGNDTLVGGGGNDKLMAGSGNDKLDGGKGNDALDGGAGKDTLDGGVGIDTMVGGDGDDMYFVENSKDVVTETNANIATGGKDTVTSTSSYTLGDNVENLILSDTQGNDINGTGNKSNNVITGSPGDNKLNGKEGNDKLAGGVGADTLDGGLGTDTLTGGNGDDVYIMNNIGDVIIEKAGGGEEDQIIASVNFNLSQSENVEYLTLSGKNATVGEGTDDDNLLQEIVGGKTNNSFNGNGGNDTINGQGGNDTLEGGDGDDELNGGVGEDVVIFSGVYGDYLITTNIDAAGVPQLTVEYSNFENTGILDGRDILNDIEILEFSDGDDVHNKADVLKDIVSAESGSSSEMVILTGVQPV